MSEQIKFTDTELQDVRNIAANLNKLLKEYGEAVYAKVQIEKEIQLIQAQLDAHQEYERTFVKTITEKYGVGNLDIQTGIFIPEIK